MAFTPRLWQTIQAQIKATVTANQVLGTLLTSTSPVSHWQLWTFIQAMTSALNEQAAAVFVDEVETIVSQAYPQTGPWIQAQVLLFQYSTVTPYLVAITNNVVAYPTVVPADRIISNSAVISGNNGTAVIKVTTGSPPGPLNSSQLIALNSYLTNFLAPSQTFNVVSVAADKLWVAGTVFYNGQLNASIQGYRVLAALNAYITEFSTSQSNGGSFNGLVKVSDIAKTIFGSSTGVVDWVPTQISVTNVFGAQTNLILGSTELARSNGTYSGYLVNDPSNPFTSTINFVPANN